MSGRRVVGVAVVERRVRPWECGAVLLVGLGWTGVRASYRVESGVYCSRSRFHRVFGSIHRTPVEELRAGAIEREVRRP